VKVLSIEGNKVRLSRKALIRESAGEADEEGSGCTGGGGSTVALPRLRNK